MISVTIPYQCFYTAREYLEIIELIVSDRIKSIMSGNNFTNMVAVYVNLYLNPPDYYWDHGMEDQWRSEAINEILTVFNLVESDLNYENAMLLLSMHSGKQYYISKTTPYYAVVFIQD